MVEQGSEHMAYRTVDWEKRIHLRRQKDLRNGCPRHLGKSPWCKKSESWCIPQGHRKGAEVNIAHPSVSKGV